jgi:hypothetical protein
MKNIISLFLLVIFTGCVMAPVYAPHGSPSQAPFSRGDIVLVSVREANNMEKLRGQVISGYWDRLSRVWRYEVRFPNRTFDWPVWHAGSYVYEERFARTDWFYSFEIELEQPQK